MLTPGDEIRVTSKTNAGAWATYLLVEHRHGRWEAVTLEMSSPWGQEGIGRIAHLDPHLEENWIVCVIGPNPYVEIVEAYE